jgi:hypothetical protein
LLPVFLYQLLPPLFKEFHGRLWVFMKFLYVVLVFSDLPLPHSVYVCASESTLLLQLSDYLHDLSLMPSDTPSLDNTADPFVFSYLSLSLFHLLLDLFTPPLLSLPLQLRLAPDPYDVINLPSLGHLLRLDLMLLLLEAPDAVL